MNNGMEVVCSKSRNTIALRDEEKGPFLVFHKKMCFWVFMAEIDDSEVIFDQLEELEMLGVDSYLPEDLPSDEMQTFLGSLSRARVD